MVQEEPLKEFPAPPGSPAVLEQSTDLRLREHEADTQRKLAFRLVWVLVAVIAASYGAALAGEWSRVKDWTQLVFGAVLGLAGTAVGFYFAKK